VNGIVGSPLTPANEAVFRGLARDLEAAHRSAATVTAYRQGCLSLERWLADHGHDTSLLAVDRDQAAAWLVSLQATHSKDSIASYFRSVRRVYNWLVADEQLDASPLARLPQPPGSGRPLQYPTVDEVRAMLATCRPRGGKPAFLDLRDEAVIRLFCEAGGPRCGEVAGLLLPGLDLATDTVHVNGKTGYRSIPLSAKTAKAFDRYMRARAAHPYAHLDKVVLGQQGRMRADGIYDIVARRCRLAGTRAYHPHSFRHMAAARCHEAGMSETDMMRLFGWKSREMLSRYGADGADARARAAARALALGNEL